MAVSTRSREFEEHLMYAITGITGQVGGALARYLLAAKQGVRAVLRDPAQG
jgi:NAD(P)H dehydrogenase (quinone)